jgi:hypothetical protein
MVVLLARKQYALLSIPQKGAVKEVRKNAWNDKVPEQELS